MNGMCYNEPETGKRYTSLSVWCRDERSTFSQMNTRGGNLDERIKKLDAELLKHREAIKKLRPGPAQVCDSLSFHKQYRQFARFGVVKTIAMVFAHTNRRIDGIDHVTGGGEATCTPCIAAKKM